MQIILLEKVANVGNLGDVVKVKDGFARNFLIPKGMAKRATPDNLKLLESKRAELEKAARRQARRRAGAWPRSSKARPCASCRRPASTAACSAPSARSTSPRRCRRWASPIEKSQVRLPSGPLKTVGEHPVDGRAAHGRLDARHHHRSSATPCRAEPPALPSTKAPRGAFVACAGIAARAGAALECPSVRRADPHPRPQCPTIRKSTRSSCRRTRSRRSSRCWAACMLDNDAADRIGDVVGPEDFYAEAHRLIFDAAMRLIAEGRPADVVTVSEALDSTRKLDYVGGPRLPRRAGAERPHRGEHPPLRDDRPRALDPAPARRHRGRDRRGRLPPDGPQRARGARHRRGEGAAHRRAGLARPAELRRDRPAAHRRGRAHRGALQPRRSLRRHGRGRPASPTSTGRPRGCSRATSSSSPDGRAWARRRSRSTSASTSRCT